jgi:hypothetical protein
MVSDGPSNLLRYYAAIFAVLVAVGVGFLVYNVANHALHQTPKTVVTTNVVAVKALSPAEAQVTATVRSDASVASSVSCLIGIEMPSTPLAYPSRVSVELQPGEAKTITVTRSLLHPYAAQVQVQDVALVCT